MDLLLTQTGAGVLQIDQIDHSNYSFDFDASFLFSNVFEVEGLGGGPVAPPPR